MLIPIVISNEYILSKLPEIKSLDLKKSRLYNAKIKVNTISDHLNKDYYQEIHKSINQLFPILLVVSLYLLRIVDNHFPSYQYSQIFHKDQN